MTRAQLAMGYQACEVADLATAAVTMDDPVEAVEQAARVLAAAHQLLAAAERIADPSVPTDSLQLFAYQHPEEAAADISEWLRRCRGRGPEGADARAGG
ncbi:hypothetical protein ACIA58_30140 [Kribbella sp. NPDC051586]|uniref:hypothetical protein n=1 Tax=Kribbella sp. NPDC051586 TaxID=3364118 RepID=UPI0037955FC3